MRPDLILAVKVAAAGLDTTASQVLKTAAKQ
jgi:hypothetical protein